ncbi:hypothetical protein [Thiococcus pfennigii]|uniref:hypothetical protein n=1 Tax=Thiococcus pfennigii TaxID=1057 RepID=UPI00190780B8|nr:hypothetical protein [Thiococcus pfennigii]MBK1731782.1 hypothetical protein [Thiococcus pfennigii]
MAVALDQVRIPGPPPGLALDATERDDPRPAVRYRRRLIQWFGLDDDLDGRLGLIDKALPHALHDLMLSDLAVRERATPADVPAGTARLFWRTGLGFVRFVADPEVRRRFGLAGATVHLAMNCDPHTRDRESIQAAKQFHLHLICWTRAELAALADPGPLERLGDLADAALLRQVLDPLAFLGADLVADAVADLPLGLAGADWLAPSPAEVVAGRRPAGAVLRLPGWQALDDPAFADLVGRLHGRLAPWAARLLGAFTGRSEPPPRWRRHRLLPRARIAANLARLPLSAASRAGLAVLAERLHDLPAPLAERLAAATPARRARLMTLNQPSYALCLQEARQENGRETRSGTGTGEGPAVYLCLQPKLFSGIGGAGLLRLAGVPCVRVRRGCGTFTAAQWAERARFQRAFAAFNEARLSGTPRLVCGPRRTFAGPPAGWVDGTAGDPGAAGRCNRDPCNDHVAQS